MTSTQSCIVIQQCLHNICIHAFLTFLPTPLQKGQTNIFSENQRTETQVSIPRNRKGVKYYISNLNLPPQNRYSVLQKEGENQKIPRKHILHYSQHTTPPPFPPCQTLSHIPMNKKGEFSSNPFTFSPSLLKIPRDFPIFFQGNALFSSMLFPPFFALKNRKQEK